MTQQLAPVEATSLAAKEAANAAMPMTFNLDGTVATLTHEQIVQLLTLAHDVVLNTRSKTDTSLPIAELEVLLFETNAIPDTYFDLDLEDAKQEWILVHPSPEEQAETTFLDWLADYFPGLVKDALLDEAADVMEAALVNEEIPEYFAELTQRCREATGNVPGDPVIGDTE